MLLKFEYTDSKGKITQRVVYREPSSNDTSLFGQDLGELSEEEIQEYIEARENAKQQYDKLVAEINEAYELKHKYRNFLKKNITFKE